MYLTYRQLQAKLNNLIESELDQFVEIYDVTGDVVMVAEVFTKSHKTGRKDDMNQELPPDQHFIYIND